MSKYALNDYAFQVELKKIQKAIKNGADIDLLDEEGYSPHTGQSKKDIRKSSGT